MDRWAVRYAGRASFVCACLDGSQLAETFASELRLAHCRNVWVDSAGMPRWGQLGCQGFIVCDGRGAVTCRATSAFLDVDDRAFRDVEARLEALVGDGGEGGHAAAAAAIYPGAVCEVHSLVQRPDLNGLRVTCVGAAGGRCLVRIADGPTMKIRPSNLKIVDLVDERAKRQRGGCGECNCGDKEKSACDEETGAEKGTDGTREAEAGTTEKGLAVQEDDASEAARVRKVPPVADPAAPVADLEVKRPAMPAKREAFQGVLSLGVCANDLCFCADCECGRGCTCNVASQEVEQQESCDPCTDFRREKKVAGGGAPAAAPSCATVDAAAVGGK